METDMTGRTTRVTLTFTKPFILAGMDEELPPGDYTVETDEDLLEGLSFTAYRRTQTRLHLPVSPRYPGRSRTLSIRPEDLDAALVRDQAKDPETEAAAEARAENEGMAPHPQQP